jgi:pyruvate dehydrogenase E2 component (dihydrolipoyllysine-residue acetyltransferase)
MAGVVMPRLSDSMEEGTIVRWCKRDGEDVDRGEELVEIETDKATVTYEAENAGPLRIIAAAGQTVAVGALIAEIGAATAGSSNGASRTARAKASPVARRLADRLGVDLGAVRGTGPAGRIVKRDIEAAASAPVPAHDPAGVRADGLRGEVEVQPASSVQSTIARRMAEAKSTMPEFTLTTDVDMDEIVRLRAQLRDVASEPAPSINDFVVKACAATLRRHPRVNASYRDGGFEIYGRVNVGVAVAVPEALVVPTVFDADEKSLGRIAAETRALSERARAGALTPAELAGGTFTISNLGMFGITQFTAVLNPPQAAILAVGSLEERVVLRDGVAAASSRMTLTLTCDHRILYGADAAAFLRDVRGLLEQPLRLAL